MPKTSMRPLYRTVLEFLILPNRSIRNITTEHLIASLPYFYANNLPAFAHITHELARRYATHLAYPIPIPPAYTALRIQQAQKDLHHAETIIARLSRNSTRFPTLAPLFTDTTTT